MRTFNILAPQLDLSSERDGYRWRGAEVGRAVGSEQIGARLYELGEGESSRPFHFHHGIEEWLLVVSGAPHVRTPDGERALRAGDVLCFPVGEGGGHRVTGPGTVLIVSDRRDLDVVEYPDSGTVELRPSGTTFRTRDAVDPGGDR
jgi:uncharacterized cupin superfamily protein